MTRNNPTVDKTAGSYDEQPATVELDDGRVIDAAHHFVSEDGDRLHLYVHERAGGIDITVPLSASAATVWARSQEGQEALGKHAIVAHVERDGRDDGDGAEDDLRAFKETTRRLGNDRIGAWGEPQTGDDSDDDSDDGVDRGGVMTDGGYEHDYDFVSGHHSFMCRLGEAVRVIGNYDCDSGDAGVEVDQHHDWVLAEINEFDDGAVNVVIAREDGSSLSVTDDDIAADVMVDENGRPVGSEAAWPFEYEDPQTGDDGRELVADGGRDVTDCPGCGADLIEAGEIGTELVPALGARAPNPRMLNAPMAECGECGRYFSAGEGWETVKALWDAHDERLPGDDGDDGDDGEEERADAADRDRRQCLADDCDTETGHHPPFCNEHLDDQDGDDDVDRGDALVTDGGYPIDQNRNRNVTIDDVLATARERAEHRPECSECNGLAKEGREVCEACVRRFWRQCDVDGCEEEPGIDTTFCDEHLDTSRDGVETCVNPACSEPVQPRELLCSGHCATVLQSAQARNEGAAWNGRNGIRTVKNDRLRAHIDRVAEFLREDRSSPPSKFCGVVRDRDGEEDSDDGGDEPLYDLMPDDGNGSDDGSDDDPVIMTDGGVKLPPGINDGDDAPLVDESVLNGDVGIDDVTDIEPPRPVTATVAARFLKFDGTDHYQAKYELPERDDVDCDCNEGCDCIASDHPEQDLECECDDDRCDCEETGDGVPLQSTIAPVHEVIDACEKIDGIEQSLYGRVARRIETNGLGDDALVYLADGSGVTVVEVHPDAVVGDDVTIEPGDEALIADVERDEDGEAAFTVTEESAVIRVATGDKDPEYYLEEQSELVHADDKFAEYDTAAEARDWMANVIVHEWDIRTPRGGDAMYLYIDDEDADDHGVFVADREENSHITEILDEYLPPASCNTTNKNELCALIRDRTRVPADAFVGGAPDHEALRWSIAVENGVIDLRTGELHDHDPAWRCTAKLPVEYRPEEYDGIGEQWDWFLDEITDDEDGESDRETLMYAIGHALPRCYPVEAIFSLIGPGKNGKTIFNKGISALLDPVTGAFEAAALAGDGEFGSGALIGNHLIIDDDATGVKAHDISALKRHSGGSDGEVNVKYQERSDYQNYASFWLLTNDPMALGDKSDGAKRRMYPVILPNRFTDDPTDDNKDAIEEEELMRRLTSDEELEALLVAAVAYAQDMYRSGEISAGRSEEERWDIYERYSDGVLRFWEELTESDQGTRVPRSVIYETYVQWADAEGIDALAAGGQNGFWTLSDQCPAVSYKRNGIWLGDERAIEHVMINDEALKYAPEWVAEEWEADVAESESTLANRLDRVTPLADLSKGYCTTEGTVIGREIIESQTGIGVKVTIEDSTRAIDVIEWTAPDDQETGALDGVDAGDSIRMERAMLTARKGVPQLEVKNVTGVTVSASGVFEEVDDRDADGEDADDDADDGGESGDADGESEEQSIEDSRETMRNIVASQEMRDDVEGARRDRVIEQASEKGVDEPERTLERLMHSGAVYEPKDDRLKTTDSSNGGEA